MHGSLPLTTPEPFRVPLVPYSIAQVAIRHSELEFLASIRLQDSMLVAKKSPAVAGSRYQEHHVPAALAVAVGTHWHLPWDGRASTF